MSNAATPQPDPAPADGDVWAEIIDHLPPSPLRTACEARRQMGINKYGVPLQRSNGRDHGIDEAQEYLDAAAYRVARLGEPDEHCWLILGMAEELLEGGEE